MRRGFVIFLTIFQTVMFAAHFLVTETWLHFWGGTVSHPVYVAVAVFLLSVSFLAASLLSFRYWNGFTRTFYRFAATWLGVLNFLFFASFGAWATALAKTLLGASWRNREIIAVWFGL